MLPIFSSVKTSHRVYLKHCDSVVFKHTYLPWLNWSCIIFRYLSNAIMIQYYVKYQFYSNMYMYTNKEGCY